MSVTPYAPRRDGPVRLGVVGCGMISAVYLKNLARDRRVTLAACADLDMGRAQERARSFGVAQALDVDTLLAHPDIDAVLDLTGPSAHGEVNLRALEAGKAVYSEKPLALDASQAHALVELADARGLPIGCAPDTVLGPGFTAARRRLADGEIGRPFAAAAHMLSSGVESWHPAPEPWYRPGGGPLFDMGPYYLTALCTLLGPVARVSAEADAAFAQRTLGAGPRAGARVEVETPTHVAGVLRFASGPIATLVTSFDVAASRLPHLELYGTEGTLALPDPNGYGGPVEVGTHEGWQGADVAAASAPNLRGLGVLDLVDAWREGREPRASGRRAAHVVAVMEAMLSSAADGRVREVPRA